ncbi:MAG: hypothetical protein QGH39_10790 [Candidatus Thermoplasmatota archaeon]|jgi:hypothetical protein|nr:hypothetical protein [Candidatus Thermoplasmatota archaeon]MDP7266031.1 hypothetical protein [Candidatus Thermoplasmatota archaeon]
MSWEKRDVNEEKFNAADFEVRMAARVFVSMMGKVANKIIS